MNSEELKSELKQIIDTEQAFNGNVDLIQVVSRNITMLTDVIENNDLKYEEDYLSITNAKIYLNLLLNILRVLKQANIE